MILINCDKKIIGRISSIISKILINFFLFKKKIIIILFNIKNIIIKKKFLYKHSGYIGNLKLKKEKNIILLKKSIYKMLPKNKTRFKIIKKIFFFESL